MISTGREYDRLVIALVVISVFILALYVMKCNKNNANTLKAQQSKFTDRLDYLTRQMDKTSQNVKDMQIPVVDKKKEEESESKVPTPVTSSFLTGS